jgi:putative sterol carrier protein
MKHDFNYWQEHGFYDSFEKYIGQETAEVPFDGELRDAWIKEMIEEQKSKKRARAGELKREASATAQPAKSCRELLQSMPLGFNPGAAGELRAVFQFEIHGDENFISYLEIALGRCTYHDGPANKPNLIIKSPADVWLKISRGELSGQKAFMEGRYKVEGDMNLLLKLSSLFSA